MESPRAYEQESVHSVCDGKGGGVVAAEDLAVVGGPACSSAHERGLPMPLQGLGRLPEPVDVLDGGG